MSSLLPPIMMMRITFQNPRPLCKVGLGLASGNLPGDLMSTLLSTSYLTRWLIVTARHLVDAEHHTSFPESSFFIRGGKPRPT